MQTTANRVQLSEIFTSIEGEGILIGTKTLFIRMAGCHLGCIWCDTGYALPFNSGKEYTVDHVKDLLSNELLQFVRKHILHLIYRIFFAAIERQCVSSIAPYAS